MEPSDVFAAIDSLRQFTEFTISNLAKSVDARFDKLEGRFDKLEGRFGELEGRFDRMDRRFSRLETRVEDLETTVRNGFDGVNVRLAALERQAL